MANRHFISIIDKWSEILATIIADYIVTEAFYPYLERRSRGFLRYKLHPGLRYVDLDRFKPFNRIAERENVIGFIGRLEEDKGIIDFAKIMKIIVAQAKNSGNIDIKNIKFFIIGSGKLEPLIRHLSVRFLNEGIYVKFHGFVEHEKLPSILNNIKILALPYKSSMEGFPTVIMEALACGTPIIVYDVGLVSNILVHGETGLIVSRGCYKDMAWIIMDVLNNQEFLEFISRNGRLIAEKLFSIRAAEKRYSNLIRRLLV